MSSIAHMTGPENSSCDTSQEVKKKFRQAVGYVQRWDTTSNTARIGKTSGEVLHTFRESNGNPIDQRLQNVQDSNSLEAKMI